MKKVVVLHDRFPCYAGGENVGIHLAKALDAPLVTAYFDYSLIDYLNSGVYIKPFQQHKYINSKMKRFYRREAIETLSIVHDFEGLDLSEYDIIVSSGVLSRAYIPVGDQRVINYIHSPPRWLYDLNRVRMNMLPKILRPFARFWAQWWRNWDLSVSNYVDCYIANSPVVQERIKKYLRRESIIIPPPVDTKKFIHKEDFGYYLSINRLFPEKRIDVIIEAFKKTKKELILIGSGNEKVYKKQAKNAKNIHFLGTVSEYKKISLLSECTGVIYIPMEEDFGIVPIEAFASGKPVIGANEGFTKHQISSFVNGLVLPEPTSDSLLGCIQAMEEQKWNPTIIQQTAKEYDVSEFEKKIKAVVEKFQNV